MKYKQELIDKARNGEIQIFTNEDDKWDDLLNYIWPKRTSYIILNYYSADANHFEYKCHHHHSYSIPIVNASDFIINEPEIKWVEVRSSDGSPWKKRIFLGDLGPTIELRYICVIEQYSNKYLEGNKSVDVFGWSQMREIVELENLTHKEIEELIGRPFNYVEE